MVATVNAPFGSWNRASVGQGYDGVVRLSVDGHYGTGALLYGGRAVLTAAHLFSGVASQATVYFETVSGTQSVLASTVLPMPGYDAANTNNDLALVWLASAAPIVAERYDLYRAESGVGKTFTFVGYGTPGTGLSGVDTTYRGGAVRQKAGNQFDVDVGTVTTSVGSQMNWLPAKGTQLVADFDSGSARNDAIGNMVGLYGLGLGGDEGMLTPGDSGGPAFIDGKIAGVASYTASLVTAGLNPDVDAKVDSSYGEMGFWQRVGYFEQWIDQSLRAAYMNVPAVPGEVKKTVAEGQSGTGIAYFLVQFTGVRASDGQRLSVDYATRDGTARAGEDYLATSGTLVLYSGENQAVIPVEIIGDQKPEMDETFYLDITNPVGGSFGSGVIQLTAMRTIANDDGL